MPELFRESHSSLVTLSLDCGEHGSLALSRVSPKSIVAKIPRNIPPCIATLIVSIDGELLHQLVELPRGLRQSRGAALIRPIEDAPF